MKKNFALIFLILFLIACGSKKTTEQQAEATPANTAVDEIKVITDTFKQGVIVPNIPCFNDASKSFALYIPDDMGPLPGIIFLFDAHGDPLVPLTKYKKLADEFKFVLVGSYDSKNGNDWNTTAQIWQALIAEKRITYDTRRIYTAGFSGGAKVASYIALNNSNIAGVIANSAGFPETQQQAPAGSFSFLGIAGRTDMNMTELVALEASLNQQTQIKHQLLMFDGKHEWCPLETMHDAFVWLHFNEVKKSINTTDPKWRDDFVALHNKKIDRLKKENNLLALADENKLMANYLEGISALSATYQNVYLEITKSPAYQKQLADYNSLLDRERNMKSNLAAALQQNIDVDFWKQTVGELNKQANVKTAEGAMIKRVLSYLSLVAYSFSNRTLNTGDNETAGKYIPLYKVIDPTNAEAYYFAAMLNARAKNLDAAKTELQKAVANGFNDWSRLKAQQEFTGMNLSELEK